MKPKFKNSFIKPIEHALREHFAKPIKHRVKFELAKIYRSLLGLVSKVSFIAVTGSCGKTTTTELIAAILEKQGRTRKGSHENTMPYLVKTILSVSPKHRFCVSEVSAGAPGQIKKSAKLLKPHIGVVTHVGQDHYGFFRDMELTAAEKCKLIEELPIKGVAVLNADEKYVYEMRWRTDASVISFGLAAHAMVRAEDVSCAWPGRLSLDICYEGKRLHLHTKLLGEHWAYSVLAAVSTSIAAGVPLEHTADAVESFEPIPYRMYPHETPDGITFICDNWKTPLWTIPATVDFMTKAKAERKIIVIGSISDTPKGFYHRYKTVVEQAVDVVDKILFVGDHSSSALKARPYPEDDRVMAFETLQQLDAFLSDYLKPGDLVLLKGTENVDHLQRIVISRTKKIACWQKCNKHRFCPDCRDLYTPQNT